ncbi:MAG: putative toxin-antitoxin system toxin component, PIN family [Pseudomonadales bacterium]|jgi:putative PIN family toxin of toxin-antitoxin system|nr:putative toxin-antitoxin system toxin component, PIN family [Pseudomonadales bacterium]
MRIVFDTNVVISALLWRGAPYQLFQKVRQQANLHIYSSVVLLEELSGVLSRPALAKQLSAIGWQAADVLRDYTCAVEIIEAAPLVHPICRDADDDHVLALALAAQADLIVSGDQDLLVLERFEGIAITTARQALEQLGV